MLCHSGTLRGMAPHPAQRRPRPGAGSYRRPLRRASLAFLAVLLLVYPLDWLVWRVRSVAGSGMGTVVVSSSDAATLKGNHFEVYAPVVAPAPCSRSLLPEAGAGPCWWLRRHTDQITQY